MSNNICWHEPGYPRCQRRHSGHRSLLFGRCRSGKRWFWFASLGIPSEAREHGREATEELALQAARAACVRMADGQAASARTSHDLARHYLKQLNADKRAQRPAPDTTDARLTEYLFAEHRYDPDFGPIEWSIRAFPIVRKTKKRIYYKLNWLKWLPEIDAPVISETSFKDFNDDISVLLTEKNLSGPAKPKSTVAAGARSYALIIACSSNRRRHVQTSPTFPTCAS
jgi:hypothetical protein